MEGLFDASSDLPSSHFFCESERLAVSGGGGRSLNSLSQFCDEATVVLQSLFLPAAPRDCAPFTGRAPLPVSLPPRLVQREPARTQDV